MNEALIQAAAQLTSKLPEGIQSWCFIAGFAYILHGVRRKTKDMDIVARDQDSIELIANKLRELQYESRVCEEDYFSFTKLGIEVDIIGPNFCFVTQSPHFWNRIFELDESGTKFPVPCPEDLVLLKIWTFLSPQRDPTKRRNDLSDIRYLVNKCGLDLSRIMDEAASLIGRNPSDRD